MSGTTDISALYSEFTAALTEVLAENAVGPARRARLARARAAVKKHPDYSEARYFRAVDASAGPNDRRSVWPPNFGRVQ